MGIVRVWKNFSLSCPPGGKTKVKIPLWNKQTAEALENGLPVILRCIVLDPKGFRAATSDIRIIPEELSNNRAALPLGPDAVAE